ncbi:MazG-like family protein [Thermohalobacter berrensis]|uniref:MazG-like family protein n=1 Tax=Thermohalobacter berrensis TaxID=99594 RepID=A0A419T3U0_9FIRM|nr:MazG-like family protein [Thermohalobacter berrensis]RKD32083.1 hypothetical protein BET03_11440 [Thermohalobacter berrensis]
MGFNDKNVNITKNIRVIEWLKSELLTAVASLFELLVKGVKNSQDALLDVLANIILVTYLLGKRLGISFDTIDSKVESKIKLGVVEEHNIERWYGDLSKLLDHFRKKR